MRLSAKVEYGVRAMAILAYYHQTGPLPLREIADKEGISLKFLEQIVPDLKKAGLVSSMRGAQGGYLLSYSPEEITIGDIVRAVEGPITPVSCLSDKKDVRFCEHKESCLTRPVWEKLRDRINDVLDHVSLDELVDLSPSNTIN